jgi:hypothetical protein
MGQDDSRVDVYIETAAEFAQPVLHRAAPKIQETIKWGMPFFMHGDRPICHFAAFKKHCAFGFWRGREIVKTDPKFSDDAMGHFGRIESVAQLPDDRKIASYIKTAVMRATKTANGRYT